MQYDGPIELLSMWLCLYTAEWDWNIDENLPTADSGLWAARVRLYNERHGQPPHPSALVGDMQSG
jgi:hypothetical protein